MASRAPWSADELAVLEHHAEDGDWLLAASTKISGRTTKALKVRMAKLRSSLGLGDGRRVAGGEWGTDDAWIGDAMIASQALLAAIERAGLSPQ